MIKAVIFDLWGTTLYSEGTFGKSAMKLLKIQHNEEKKFWESLEEHWMKRRFETVEEAATHTLGRTFGIKDAEKIKKFASLYEEDRKYVRLFDDVVPAIKKLRKKYKIGLLSNTDCFTGPILEEIGFLKLFDAAFLSCDHGKLKPDKNFFKRILKTLNVKPEESVMIGDTIKSDIIPAKQLGMNAIFIDRHNKHPKVKGRIKSLVDLEEVIQKM